MNQITAPPVDVDPPIGGSSLDPNAPHVRPLSMPIEQGRLWTADLDSYGRPTAYESERVWLHVMPGGHWYGSHDRMVKGYVPCRGCRLPGIAVMARTRCSHPATAQDIATALLASLQRPAPATPRRYYLRTWREGSVSE